MSKPTPELYQLALNVVYYLYLHKEVGLRYSTSDEPLLGMSKAANVTLTVPPSDSVTKSKDPALA